MNIADILNKMQMLINKSNETTGNEDLTLGTAIQSLIAGYGGGSVVTNANDMSKETLNAYIDNKNGSLKTNYPNWSATDFIEIPIWANYVIRPHFNIESVSVAANNVYAHFYDSNKNPISGITGTHICPIPEGARYFRDSCETYLLRLVIFVEL